MLKGIRGKLKKLNSMTSDELRFRLREAFNVLIELIVFRANLDHLSGYSVIKKECNTEQGRNFKAQNLSQSNNGNRDLFFLETYSRQSRRKLIDEHFDYNQWISQADQILNGEFELLGRSVYLNTTGNWHIDPIENGKWPKVFYAFVKKFNRIKNWDIKYIWELNRHQYLIVLGKAYWLTGNPIYAKKVVEIIDSWIDENPYNQGVNWTSSLELAVRSISWVWAYFFCKDSTYLTDQFCHKYRKSLYEHATYIERHLSYYSSPFNHLVGEAAALHLLGSLFSDFDNGERWERLGWSILADRIDDQFYEDGLCVEQAFFYHHFTLGFYLHSIFLRRINKKNISSHVLSKIEKALNISMHLTKPDGTLPMVGDVDNARSLFFNLHHCWDFRGFLSLGAILFNRPDFKCRSISCSEEMLWICTNNEINQYKNMNVEKPTSTSIAFYKSGYFIMRDCWHKRSNYVCFDSGRIAEGLSESNLVSAAHGHADSLSFDLSVKGKPIIIDSGFFTYFGNVDWHKYFRCEEAHNTVLIGNHRQAEYCGRLKWRKVTHPQLLSWHSEETYDTVEGSILHKGGAKHLRQLVYVKNQFWFIRDFVATPDTKSKIRSFLHFSPDIDLVVNRKRCEMVASIGRIGLYIKYLRKVELIVEKGGEEPSSGFIANGYGIKSPAYKVTFLWKDHESEEYFPLILIPFDRDKDSIAIKILNQSGNNKILDVRLMINRVAYVISMGNHDKTCFSINERKLSIRAPNI